MALRDRIRLLIKEVSGFYEQENFRRIEDFINQNTEDSTRKYLSDTIIDFKASFIRHEQLVANTKYTVKNPILNKRIILELKGAFTLSLGDNVFTTSGTYDGTKRNWIFITCVDDVAPTYIAQIETEL
jgi:hypothetical protein